MSHGGGGPESDKPALRREFLAVRNRLTPDDVRTAAAALAEHALELPELAHAGTVAAYVSVGTEPGTPALLDALRARGVRVLLPALLPDNDLDWGAYAGAGSLAPVRHGGRMELLEPGRAPLGPDAVMVVDDTVFVPAGWRSTRAGCGWGAAAGRTTVCWPVWSAPARAPPWWCSCTTRRSSSGCPPRRTTGRCGRW